MLGVRPLEDKFDGTTRRVAAGNMVEFAGVPIMRIFCPLDPRNIILILTIYAMNGAVVAPPIFDQFVT